MRDGCQQMCAPPGLRRTLPGPTPQAALISEGLSGKTSTKRPQVSAKRPPSHALRARREGGRQDCRPNSKLGPPRVAVATLSVYRGPPFAVEYIVSDDEGRGLAGTHP